MCHDMHGMAMVVYLRRGFIHVFSIMASVLFTGGVWISAAMFKYMHLLMTCKELPNSNSNDVKGIVTVKDRLVQCVVCNS